MANNFYPWIADSYATTNTVSPTDFSTDSQRTEGFKSGQAASAIRVNTALRQANLVACALMDIVAPNNPSVSAQSPLNQIRYLLGSWLVDASKLTNGTLPIDRLATISGLTPSTYGPSTNVDGQNGTTINVPQITVDAKGRVTSINNKVYTSRNTQNILSDDTPQSVSSTNSAGSSTEVARADHTHAGVASIKLNGVNTTSPEFFAPTTSGTNNEKICMSSEGAPRWVQTLYEHTFSFYWQTGAGATSVWERIHCSLTILNQNKNTMTFGQLVQHLVNNNIKAISDSSVESIFTLASGTRYLHASTLSDSRIDNIYGVRASSDGTKLQFLCCGLNISGTNVESVFEISSWPEDIDGGSGVRQVVNAKII